MKKRGFTLAEVLITLGIVGVVASLTAPSLVSTGQNKVNGSKLAATVSLLESAFHNAIATEGVENLYQTKMWENAPVCVGNGACNSTENDVRKFAGELGRYLTISSFRTTYPLDCYDEAGVKVYQMSNNLGKGDELERTYPDGQGRNGFPFFLKNGAIVTIDTYMNASPSEDVKQDAIDRGSSLYTEAADVFIDVNGFEAPNVVGRDIFAFYLGENGTLYPLGGADVAVMDDSGLWNESGSGFACIPGDAGWGGYGCTGRVIDNGYKIDY
jgi:prepilin-type N-terminal cleavage/methylation domain-containing protein